MRTSRPGPLFAALMLLSLASAFVVPPRFTTPARASAQGLFWPVARPVRFVAGAIDRRARPEQTTDDASPAAPRPAETVYAENHQLRAGLASLQVRYDQLARLNADRQLVGPIRSLCDPATVTGSDASGVREALTVSGIGAAAVDKPAVHGTDLVGRVQTAGLTGGTVRLLTDPGFAFTTRVARYVTDPSGKMTVTFVPGVRPLVQGVGHGAMAIRSTLTMQQVADLHLVVGDSVVLDDTAGWPDSVQGFTVGRIAAIAPASVPIFADIRVEPVADLNRLTEVMVVVRGGPGS